MTNISYPANNAPMPLGILMKNADGTPRSFNFLNDGINPLQPNRYIFVSGGIPDLFVENYTMTASPQYAARVNIHSHYSHASKSSGVSHASSCAYTCHVAAPSAAIDDHFLMFSGFRWMWHQLWSHNTTMRTHAIEIMFRCSNPNPPGIAHYVRVGLMNARNVDNASHPGNFGRDRYVTSVLLKSENNIRDIEDLTYLDQNCMIASPSLTPASDARIKSTNSEYFTLRVVIDPASALMTAYLRSYATTPVLPGGLDWDGGIDVTTLYVGVPFCTDVKELAPAISSNAYGTGADEPISICGFRWLPA